MHSHRTLRLCFSLNRLIRPLCCVLALIHPLIHGTVFDQGALDALIQYGTSRPSLDD